MAVRELQEKPETMAHFPDGIYRFLELYRGDDVYAHAAITERDENLEAHLTVHHWGVQVRRHLGRDLQWFLAEARRLGKKRLLGIRADDQGEFDPNLFKFARLYGVTDCRVFQTVSLDVNLSRGGGL